MKFNRIGLIFAVFFAIAISPALGVTDTVYVQKRITDTLYVVSPPDTVYIQESSVQGAISTGNVRKYGQASKERIHHGLQYGHHSADKQILHRWRNGIHFNFIMVRCAHV